MAASLSEVSKAGFTLKTDYVCMCTQILLLRFKNSSGRITNVLVLLHLILGLLRKIKYPVQN